MWLRVLAMSGWSLHSCLPALSACSPACVPPCIPPCLPPCPPAVVLSGLEDSQKWQTKEGALQLLTALADTAPAQVAARLPTLVPLISDRMVDPREQVGELSAACQLLT